MEIKILELFGGIGACTKAFKRLGIPHKVVDYVEIDKYAVASYNAINGTNFEPQDICKWDKDIKVDLIMHGSPCQDFSLAGKQAGGDKDSGTRSSLMYETIRIVEKLKPKYVIWENVKNLLSKKHRHNFDAYLETMEQLGYTNYYQVLNAKDYGIPQNRERVFTISIRKDIEKGFVFPQKQELKLLLKDMLEDEVDEKYYLSEKMMNYVLDNNDTQKGTKWEGRADNDTLNSNIAHTLSVRSAGGNQRAGVSNFIVDDYDEEIKVKDIKLKIKNATSKGYQEAYEGDSVNLAYPDSKTRRGRVGKEVAQTLDTQCEQGVVVKDIQTIEIPQIVRTRKYEVNIEQLKKTLKDNKIYSNKEISLILNVPLTTVEHWFRNDNCFSIPNENIWFRLKTLLKISTDEFDESIMTFEEREGVYEKANRYYLDTGIAPTITNSTANEKIIVNNR